MPNNIEDDLKGPHRQFWRENLFFQYDNNNYVELLSDPITIKSLPGGTKVLWYLIVPVVK